MPERADPGELRQPALKTPVVCSAREQLFLRLLTEHRARVRPYVIDAILGKPALHLGQRVTVLLGMLILVSQPRSAPRRVMLSIA